MKNLFKGAVLTAAAAFAFTACSKDQRVVNRLEGDWKVTGFKGYVNNVQNTSITLDPNTTIIITFDDCKLKSDEWCTVTNKNTTGSQTTTQTGKYKISGDGETFTQDQDGVTTTTEDQIVATITESTKKSFKFNYSDTDGGDTYKYEFELTAQ